MAGEGFSSTRQTSKKGKEDVFLEGMKGGRADVLVQVLIAIGLLKKDTIESEAKVCKL